MKTHSEKQYLGHLGDKIDIADLEAMINSWEAATQMIPETVTTREDCKMSCKSMVNRRKERLN